MPLQALLIVLGIVLLYGGGEVLVTGATQLARRFGISPMVIGLTIVAFATSCPELAATVTATIRGSTDMALGNAIGSNIANIGLILGVSAMIYPLATNTRFLRREVAFMMLVTVSMYPILLAGSIERWHAALFLGALTFFLVNLLRNPGTGTGSEALLAENTDRARSVSAARSGLAVALGIAMLVGGAQSLVTGASTIARAFGVTDRVIGLTLVALGTSLPELATSIVAARRREAEIILGNVIGSNIFNLLFILGITALVKPLPVNPAVLRVDFWMMLGTSIAIFGLLATTRTLTRWEGTLLLVSYAGYTAYLFL